jgi:dolichol-phosphate mannosyltransferase
VRLAAASVTLSRLSSAARRRPALAVETGDVPSISVVVPARDEAGRLGPLLAALRNAPGVAEIVVVDDESTDATAEVAAASGARVVHGAPLPAGWVGKAWALDQGLRTATSEWVVTLDADTRPSSELPRSLVARARRDGLGFVTVGGRFECPTAGVRWLHPAMLTTLVYRFGAPDALRPVRVLANGQCMAFSRQPLLDEGGFAPVAHHVVEDVALARLLRRRGWSVAMLDGPDLLTTRMFENLADAWRGWSRSLALPGVEPRVRQLLDIALVAVGQALPLPRVLLRRFDVIDVVLLAARLGTLAGTRRAYDRAGIAYWASPLADLGALGALVSGVIPRSHSWRGRRYAASLPTQPSRSAAR